VFNESFWGEGTEPKMWGYTPEGDETCGGEKKTLRSRQVRMGSTGNKKFRNQGDGKKIKKKKKGSAGKTVADSCPRSPRTEGELFSGSMERAGGCSMVRTYSPTSATTLARGRSIGTEERSNTN